MYGLRKTYAVFNAEQIDGLPEKFKPQPVTLTTHERDARAESYFKATGADIRHGGNQAFFAPGQDFIQMPVLDRFQSRQGYYSTLAHEMTHWTGHKSRLNREFKTREKTIDYAKEELVAEMGAAFLCASLDLSKQPRDEHVSYLQSWLKALKDDKKLIFTAATKAQAAVAYLDSLQSEAGLKPRTALPFRLQATLAL